MKKVIFLFLYIFSISNVEAQVKSYLLVSIQKNYDKFNNRTYFSLNTEVNLDSNLKDNPLKTYQEKLKIDPYLIKNGSWQQSTERYNYFTTSSEALNFLASYNWTVKSMATEISSGSANEVAVGVVTPITTVYGKIIFLLER